MSDTVRNVTVAVQLAEYAAASTPGKWPTWSADRAKGIPGVGRALAIYCGLISQMPMDRWRGQQMLPRTRLLRRPQPDRGRGWFIAAQVEDWWVHGNAIHLITARDAEQQAMAVVHLPASMVDLKQDRKRPLAPPTYRLRDLDGNAVDLPSADVVHVRRGIDPTFPARGVGAVEQHLRSLGRVYHQEQSQDGNMVGGGVPSVAIIASNPRLSEEEIDQGLTQWDQMFGGPVRRPGLFPHGTVVTPLAWSPTDSQMVEAMQMSLTDIANSFNLNGYWVGAPSSSHTYRSPGPMFTDLSRASLGPVVGQLEEEWGHMWLPHTQDLRLNRRAIEQDTLAEIMATVSGAVSTAGAVDGEQLLTTEEGRGLLALALSGSMSELAGAAPARTEEGGAA